MDRIKKKSKLLGQHGYDPSFPEMQGIFWAVGPAFKDYESHVSFENTDLFNLMNNVLGIPPDQTRDGSEMLSRAVLV